MIYKAKCLDIVDAGAKKKSVLIKHLSQIRRLLCGLPEARIGSDGHLLACFSLSRQTRGRNIGRELGSAPIAPITPITTVDFNLVCR